MSTSAIFARVERELGVSFEEKLRPQIVHLKMCDWSFYPFPVMTLILQSAASVVGAIEAMTKCIPDVVVSLLACSFFLWTFFINISHSFLVYFIWLFSFFMIHLHVFTMLFLIVFYCIVDWFHWTCFYLSCVCCLWFGSHFVHALSSYFHGNAPRC